MDRIYITETDSSTALTILPNKEYVFGEVSDLSFSFGDEQEGKRNQYILNFVVAEDFSFNIPDGVIWSGQKTPDFIVGETYIVTIENNIAYFVTTAKTEELSVTDDGSGIISFKMG